MAKKRKSKSPKSVGFSYGREWKLVENPPPVTGFLDAKTAALLYQTEIRAEAQAENKRQRRIAKQPRRDRLTREIMKILKRDQNASNQLIKARLASVWEIDDESISWTDDKGGIKETRLSGLPSRISRARRALKTS